VFEEVKAHSDLAKRILTRALLLPVQDIGGWMKLSDVAYSVQRNRVLGL
jgi:hypothetical protein